MKCGKKFYAVINFSAARWERQEVGIKINAHHCAKMYAFTRFYIFMSPSLCSFLKKWFILSAKFSSTQPLCEKKALQRTTFEDNYHFVSHCKLNTHTGTKIRARMHQNAFYGSPISFIILSCTFFAITTSFLNENAFSVFGDWNHM
jgi:hypothetical protein